MRLMVLVSTEVFSKGQKQIYTKPGHDAGWRDSDGNSHLSGPQITFKDRQTDR